MSTTISHGIWSVARQPRCNSDQTDSGGTEKSKDEGDQPSWRSVFQQDFDRLLFSTPVRRLSDKTQVWPMDENDGVRTRLTHSHEVANLARSLGSRIHEKKPQIFNADLHNVVQPILWSIGLAHDLGNPPFGHQGEVAIGAWFAGRSDWIFSHKIENQEPLSGAEDEYWKDGHWKSEFLEFDGNPQTLRLVTKLQTHAYSLGLDLSAATLAAMIKYPVSASNRNKNNPAQKKVGYFKSESDIIKWVRQETGLKEKQRHPLTWIMEACDDIAYSILDVDDVMKKGIASPEDILSQMHVKDSLSGLDVVSKIKEAFKRVDKDNRGVFVSRDVKIGYMRAFLMDALLKEASESFFANSDRIWSYDEDVLPLLEKSGLCNFLKGVAKDHAFSNPSVLKSEAVGAEAIEEIMLFFWNSISCRKDVCDISSRRTTAASKFAWSLISPNYIEEANKCINGDASGTAIRYAELRLLTDMISGMTDTFAMKLWNDIKAFQK